jgi:hypothetical protein
MTGDHSSRSLGMVCAIATLEDGRIWLRIYNEGRLTAAFELTDLRALILASDLLGHAITVQAAGAPAQWRQARGGARGEGCMGVGHRNHGE